MTKGGVGHGLMRKAYAIGNRVIMGVLAVLTNAIELRLDGY